MEAKFKLPTKWYVVITQESLQPVIKWLREAKNYGSDNTDWSIGNFYCINEQGQVRGWMYHAPERVRDYTEITFEQFKKYVLNQPTEEKTESKTENIMKYFKTKQLLNRDITLCIAVEGNKVKTGYSVRLLDDEENVEIGKKVSLGRALKDKTNLTPELSITESLTEKYILSAIAEKIFLDLEQGKIIIKGIKDKKVS